MCELFGMSTQLPTVATITLERFAARGGLDGHTIDGWGLALYDGLDLRLYREPEPSRHSAWLRYVQQRRLSATLLISHIRHATRGAVNLANTQPFAREIGGRMHVFAHNGRLEPPDADAAVPSTRRHGFRAGGLPPVRGHGTPLGRRGGSHTRAAPRRRQRVRGSHARARTRQFPLQ